MYYIFNLETNEFVAQTTNEELRDAVIQACVDLGYFVDWIGW